MTDSQQNIIPLATQPQYSAFVSASAGTGKTKLLIDRIVNLLLNGTKPEKILCLAFTKAAAAEILSRITEKLIELSICDRGILLAELKKLGFKEISPELENKARILFAEFLDATEPLSIQTIHSFCQQLLLKFPFEAGISLGFILLDDNQIYQYVKQAKNLFLNSLEENQELRKSIEYLSWHIKEFSLGELIEEIVSNRRKLEDYFQSQKTLANALTSVHPIDIAEDPIIEEFIIQIPFTKEEIAVLMQGGKNDVKKAERLLDFIEQPKVIKIIQVSDYLSCFIGQDGFPLKNLITKKISEEFLELTLKFYNEQQRVYNFRQTLNEIKLKNLSRCFIMLSYYLLNHYQLLKKQNNSLDYDDLIILVDRLLSYSEHSSWILYKLYHSIDHILVDEAQDNSARQWNIINKISEEFLYSNEQLKSIFIVGDAKQSIFSFQGAQPKYFHKMNQYLPENVLRIILNKSYRSAVKILQLVDKIFNKAHIKPLVTSFDLQIEHLAHKNSEGEIAVWPLEVRAETHDDKSWMLPSDIAEMINKKPQNSEDILAEKIAMYIKNELQNNKELYPGDFLVLSRRRNNLLTNISKKLSELQVPASGLDRIKLVKHPIILDLIALSKFLLCPADDFNLAITLKSPFFDISEDQLFSFCYKREASLFANISTTEFANTLNKLIEISKEESVFAFFFHLFEEMEYREKFVLEFSDEANDILDSFFDLITKFEENNISNLQLFVEYLMGITTEIKRDFSHNKNQVRIMTVHGAKGLQAKIVILCDTTSLPHNHDTIIWLGDGRLLWPGKAKYFSTEAEDAKAKKNADDYAEYLRLLYVGLTRAEEKLIICGNANNEKISEKSWYSIVKTAQEEL